MTESYIVFRIQNQSFGISVSYISGISKIPKIFFLPQAPPHILGVVNINGEVIPLIDGGIKLRLAAVTINERSTILTLNLNVEGKTRNLCMLVDEVLEVNEWDPRQLQPLPTSKFEFEERLVDGMFQTSNDFVSN